MSSQLHGLECALCHEAIPRAGLACPACRATHHTSCLGEGKPCASCSGMKVPVPFTLASGSEPLKQMLSIVLLTALCGMYAHHALRPHVRSPGAEPRGTGPRSAPASIQDPDLAGLLLTRVQSLEREGRFSEALGLAEGSLLTVPGCASHVRLQETRIRLLITLGRYWTARELLETSPLPASATDRQLWERSQLLARLESLTGRALDMRPALRKSLERHGRDPVLRLEIGAALARAHHMMGEFEGAAIAYVDVLDKEAAVAHPDALFRVRLLDGLARLRHDQGEYELSRMLFQKSLDLLQKMKRRTGALPAEPLALADQALLEGTLEEALGQFRAAVECYDRAIAGRETHLGLEHPGTVAVRAVRGAAMRRARCPQSTLGAALEDMRVLIQRLGTDHPAVAHSCRGVAQALAIQGDHDAALRYLDQAERARMAVQGESHPAVGTTRMHRARVNSQAGRGAEYAVLRYWAVNLLRPVAGRPGVPVTSVTIPRYQEELLESWDTD